MGYRPNNAQLLVLEPKIFAFVADKTYGGSHSDGHEQKINSKKYPYGIRRVDCSY